MLFCKFISLYLSFILPLRRFLEAGIQTMDDININFPLSTYK